MHFKTSWHLAALAFLLTITSLIYTPGLNGGFLFDDEPNIIDNPAIQIDELSFSHLWDTAVSGTTSPLKRPIATISFSINYLISGLDPTAFKSTNLVIHLLVGVLLYLLTERLLNAYAETNKNRFSANRYLLCWIITAAWLLHPINLSPVLYIVQRMTSLSALFSAAALLSYVIGRIRLSNNQGHGYLLILSAFILFTPLSIFSKENGALTPLLIFVIEYTLLLNLKTSKKQKRALTLLFSVFLAAPIIVGGILLVSHQNLFLGGYEGRLFTLGERLLTEPRALFFYLANLIAPTLSSLGLYHDDFQISQSLLRPWTTLASIISAIALIFTAIAFRKTSPVYSFGILFFFSGHLIESTIIPLDIIHEHRNYLPSYGILFALAFYADRLLRKVLRPQLVALCLSLFIGVLAFSTALRASSWGDELQHAYTEVRHHPNSARSQYDLGRLLAIHASKDTPGKLHYALDAERHFRIAASLPQADSSPIVGLIILHSDIHGNRDEKSLGMLEEHYASNPIQSPDINALASLVYYLKHKPELIDASSMNSLFSATLENKNQLGRRLANICLIATDYYANVAQDYGEAINWANSAVKLSPSDPNHRLSLAQLLIARGNIEEATKQIALASQLDPTGKYTDRIQQFRSLIPETSM